MTALLGCDLWIVACGLKSPSPAEGGVFETLARALQPRKPENQRTWGAQCEARWGWSIASRWFAFGSLVLWVEKTPAEPGVLNGRISNLALNPQHTNHKAHPFRVPR